MQANPEKHPNPAEQVFKCVEAETRHGEFGEALEESEFRLEFNLHLYFLST